MESCPLPEANVTLCFFIFSPPFFFSIACRKSPCLCWRPDAILDMFGISIEEDLVVANDFFSKMKDTIVKGANTVAGESGKLVERGKIKASVMKLEDQKKSLLMELGNKYYEAYKQDNTNSDEVRQICEQLDALHAEIEIKKQENERLKAEE